MALAGSEARCLEQIRPRRTHEDLALALAQEVVDESNPRWVELAGHVIQEQEWVCAAGGPDRRELGQLEGQAQDAVLTLGGVVARGAPLELELELVLVGPESGGTAPAVLGAPYP